MKRSKVEEFQPYMAEIDYTPGRFEALMLEMKNKIFKNTGIPRIFLKIYPKSYLDTKRGLFIFKK